MQNSIKVLKTDFLPDWSNWNKKILAEKVGFLFPSVASGSLREKPGNLLVTLRACRFSTNAFAFIAKVQIPFESHRFVSRLVDSRGFSIFWLFIIGGEGVRNSFTSGRFMKLTKPKKVS